MAENPLPSLPLRAPDHWPTPDEITRRANAIARGSVNSPQAVHIDRRGGPRLLLAELLARNVADLEHFCRRWHNPPADAAERQHLKRAAYLSLSWLLESGAKDFFSFASVCQFFGYDPGQARKRVLSPLDAEPLEYLRVPAFREWRTNHPRGESPLEEPPPIDDNPPHERGAEQPAC